MWGSVGTYRSKIPPVPICEYPTEHACAFFLVFIKFLRFFIILSIKVQRPFIVQYFFPVQKRTLYAPPVCDFIFELPCTSVESYVRLHVKTSISFFFVRCGDHTYHVLGTRYLYGSSLYCCRWSLQQVPTSVALLCEKGDAVRIEPRPPSPSTCRLCERSSRTLLRPQASGDGTGMQSVLGESRASCRLSIDSRAESNSGLQQQQYYEELVHNS